MKKRIAFRLTCVAALGYLPVWLLLSGIHQGDVFQIVSGIGGIIILVIFGMLSWQEVHLVEVLKRYNADLRTGHADLKTENAKLLLVVKRQDEMLRQVLGEEGHETYSQGPISSAPTSPAPGFGRISDD